MCRRRPPLLDLRHSCKDLKKNNDFKNVFKLVAIKFCLLELNRLVKRIKNFIFEQKFNESFLTLIYLFNILLKENEILQF
jgi:hypothetical protein